MAAKGEGPYPDVRALERGLHLIEALAEHGWLGPAELARHTGIDRATIYRLLATLEHNGFVVRHPQRAKYFLSSKFHSLGSSVQARDELVMLVSGPLNNLVKQINWPSDFGVLDGGRLVIAGSNHALTTMTFYRAIVGQTRPVMRSALGRAILSAMSEEERAAAIDAIIMAGGPDAEDVADKHAVEALVANTRRRGYALSLGEADSQVSAIALPVVSKKGVVGAINIVFFRSTFRIDWVERYLEPLRKCIQEVEAAYDQHDGIAIPPL